MVRRAITLFVATMLCSCSSQPQPCPQIDAAITDSPAGDTSAPATDATADAAADVQACAPPKASGSACKGYQIDVAHSGAQPNDTLTLPLCRRWVANVGGTASYAAVEHGRVFVTTGNGSENVQLYAFDEHTGAPLWGPLVIDYEVGFAEDNDLVFVTSLLGKVQAIAADTGQQVWQVQLGSGSTQASPTAIDGRVYIASAGQTTYALDESSGSIVWFQYPSILTSTPTIAGSSLFEGYGTARVFSLDANDGGVIWNVTTTSFGGGIDTTAAYGGRIYSPGGGGGIFDQVSGKLVGLFASDRVPAFGKQLVLYVQDPNVIAVDPASSKMLWTFDAGVRVTVPPITIGDVAVIATEFGQFFVLDSTTGKLLASDSIGASIPANFSASLVGGLAAADGMLFIGGDGRVVAY